ncbi:MAG: DinB family protein, partial [Dehalococcoidia bacterium]
AWCRAALEENGVDVSGVSGTPVAIPIEDAPGHGVHELIDALVAERAGTIDFIKSLSLEQFQRTAKTRVFGELTVMQWLRSFYRHDRQHSAQIQGRRSDYQPNFGDGKEPDQRRMRIQQVKARSQTSP